MTEQPNDVQATSDAPEVQDTDQRTDLNSLPADVRKYIESLRKEAAEHRIRAKAEAEQRAREEQERLAQQQEWQKLAELRARELEELKPKAERLDTLEAFMRSTVEARIEALPEQYRTLVPDYDDPVKTLAWLDANASKLSAPRPPATDAGVRGDSGATLPKLTDIERELARMAGMTPEQYAEIKAKKAAQQQLPTFPNL